MRSSDHDSNYLAKTEKSDFDNLFRRISGLANTWLDHNACITKNRQITELVTRIEKENILGKNLAQNTFLSSPEFFLGQFIQAVFTLQDEEQSDAMRSHLHKKLTQVLDAFDQIKVEHPIKPSVDWNKLSHETQPHESQLADIDDDRRAHRRKPVWSQIVERVRQLF